MILKLMSSFWMGKRLSRGILYKVPVIVSEADLSIENRVHVNDTGNPHSWD